jgi:MFS transporter, DHA1 family, inner membrane transport protein
MAFFHNRTVNLLNLHYVIGSVAMSGAGAFYTAYFLKAGLSVPVTLFATGAMFALRLVLRTVVLPLGIRIGLRRLVVIGSLLMGASYPFIPGVHGLGSALALVIFVSALADSVYWPSYHAYFAALGDAEHRGQQLGVREGLTALIGIVSPLAMGWMLVALGSQTAFWSMGLIQAASAIPLLWMPDVAVARRAPGVMRAALRGALLFSGDGWSTAGYLIAWQAALFLTLGKNFIAYGGALAIAALVGGIAGLFLGRLIDSGRGTRAVWLAIGVSVLVTAMRVALWRDPVLAVAANALGAFVTCLYIPTMMTAVYNSAKRSGCVLRFHVAAEGGWDIGVSTGLWLCAALTALGFSLGAAVATSLFGFAFVFVMLLRYYRAHPSERIDAHDTLEGQSLEAPRM